MTKAAPAFFPLISYNKPALVLAIFAERNFIIGTRFITGTPPKHTENRSFRDPDC